MINKHTDKLTNYIIRYLVKIFIVLQKFRGKRFLEKLSRKKIDNFANYIFHDKQ